MYFSIYQVGNSILNLKKLNPFFGISFLAFKKTSLPVGEITTINATQLLETFMKEYYKPYQNIDAFFSPFLSSKSKDIDKGWVAKRYPSTSLQRITTDTFGSAFIHKKGESLWSWSSNYVNILKNYLQDNLIPMLDLSIWIYRNEKWPSNVTPKDICNKFINEFHINETEMTLFSTSSDIILDWLSDSNINDSDLSELIGFPDGEYTPETKNLNYIELSYVGPSGSTLRYEPSTRMNILTGDNGLGKTFLFDSIWWSVCRNWIESTALPNENAPKPLPKIECGFNLSNHQVQKEIFRYDWLSQEWQPQLAVQFAPALMVYAKHDGAFSIWDNSKRNEKSAVYDKGLYLSTIEVWNGKSNPSRNNSWVCNGLIIDWTNWQNNSKYTHIFNTLIKCLEVLSPDPHQIISPGKKSVRIPNDSRDIPTLHLNYGDVPILHCSAGMKRILSILYMLIWSWFEYKISIENRHFEQNNNQIILIIDEIDAHLHPKWQRRIIPSILKVLKIIGINEEFQLHISTHSSLILSSIESSFDESTDQIHVFSQQNKEILIDKIPFIKRGTSDLWLMSDVFDRQNPRSIESDEIINKAKELQLQQSPLSSDVHHIHNQLIRILAEDDSFWPYWLYFAKKNGVS